MSRKYVLKSAEWVEAMQARVDAQAARIAELDAGYTEAALAITAAREDTARLERQIRELGFIPAMQLGSFTGDGEPTASDNYTGLAFRTDVPEAE